MPRAETPTPLEELIFAPPTRKKIVRTIHRWFLAEDGAQAGRRHVARAALGAVVLARAFNGDGERAPLRAPFEFPGEFATAIEGRNLSAMTAAPRPLDEVGFALVGDFLAVVSRDFRGADASALLADNLKWVPGLRPFRAADFLIDAPHDVRVAKNHVNRLVELAGAVDVPHPVKLRLDAKFLEHAPELGNEVVSHVGGCRAGWWRDIAEWRAEILLEMLGLAVGNLVHRIVIITAEAITNGHAFRMERSKNSVVNQRSAQRAHMRAPRRRLRVVNRLRPFNLLDQLVTPKHIFVSLFRTDMVFER